VTTIDEMWAAFEAHEPEPAYAEAWATLLKERTYDAARVAYYAAPEGSAAVAAAAAAEAAAAAWATEHYAQQAIDALREVKP